MIFSLIPDNLNSSNEDGIQIIDYHINRSNLKNKVELTKNVFSFLLDGTKGIVADGEVAEINNTMFMLAGRGKCLMTEKISTNNNYHSILLFFDDSSLHSFCDKAEIILTNDYHYQPYTIFKNDAYITQYINSLILIQTGNLDKQKGLVKAKFEELMYYLVNQYGKNFIYNILLPKREDDKTFKRIVESNKLNNLSIQELSFLCNMSTSTFKRYFKKHYNTSPIKWFQQKRLKHAAYLLEFEKQRPSEIYLKLGFENQSSFTHAFKQRYNITPTQFQDRK